MATLTVLKFPTAEGAKDMLDTIKSMQKEELITLQDAAIVTWPVGKKSPSTKQLTSMGGIGALQGAFWGMLFGLIFFVPFFGMAVGALMGGLAGHFADYGISDEFIKQVRAQVTEGTSALFLMTTKAVTDKVIDRLKRYDFELISSNLTAEQEAQLREAFAEGEIVAD
ncbi:MAG: DUF1269 domain-containing protein [Chloroflexota bacterium]|nr:MAG: DUF1269 domain-containing protein [Chloroflexota bacterium]